MRISEQPLDKADEIVKDGRVFKPVYKHLLDNMPRDLVQEMARRRLAELESGKAEKKE
ncbi:MAG: hypothetical protein LBK00_11705 [Treponema sp.]|jgi:hypothetical protein|nr:hypothetical protein [Treponema sp.]